MGSKRFIYELEYSRQRNICKLLDSDQQYKLLAGKIGWSIDDINELERALYRQGGSPTSDLLTRWGHSNATIELLASYLLELKLIRAAELLRDLVPKSLFSSYLNTNDLRNENSNHGGKTNHASCEADLPLPCPPVVNTRVMEKQQHVHKREEQSWNQCKSNNEDVSNINTQSSYMCKGKRASQNSYSESLTATASYRSYPTGDISGKLLSNDYRPISSSTIKRVPIMHSHKDEGCTDITTDVCRTVAASGSFEQLSNSAMRSKKDSGSMDMMGDVMHYPYDDILNGTKNFDKSTVLGHGGFGIVYRGNMKKTHMIVAIKVLNKKQDRESNTDFLAEIKSLQKYRHKNIITLCGCSYDGPSVCLIYEYMVHGSLLDCLECKNNASPLPWPIRHGILKDAASGLQYLHTANDKQPLIHGDVKSANILMGRQYEAKISDFGLAKQATGGATTGKLTHITHQDFETVFGSRAYLPDDFATSGYQFSLKTDVYGFGIVILETCTDEKPEDNRREGGRLLRDYIENARLESGDNNESQLFSKKDRKMIDWPNELWIKLLMLGLECSAKMKKNRPTMDEVHKQLESLHREMLKQQSPGKQNGNDVSISQSSYPSQRSNYVLHESNADDCDLYAGNDNDGAGQERHLSPLDLQKVYDHRKAAADRRNLSPAAAAEYNTSLVYTCDTKKLREIEEQFASGISAKENENGIASSDYPSMSSVGASECASGSDSCVSECLRNFQNDRAEGVTMPSEPETSLLEWRYRVQQLSGNLSAAGLVVLSDDLANIREKEYPPFMQKLLRQPMEGEKGSLEEWRRQPASVDFVPPGCISADSSLALTEELEQMKKKEFPQFMKDLLHSNTDEDDDDEEDEEEDDYEDEGEKQRTSVPEMTSFGEERTNRSKELPVRPVDSAISESDEIRFQPVFESDQSNNGETVIQETISHETRDHDLLGVETERGDRQYFPDFRQMCIPIEDQKRAEKLEQLKRSRIALK